MADNLKILKNLFATLQDPLFLGDGVDTGEFHALLQPGQFLSTKIVEADGTDDMATQSALVDLALDSQFIYKSLNSTVSQQYKDALTEEALPYVAISAAVQKEIDTTNSWLDAHEPIRT